MRWGWRLILYSASSWQTSRHTPSAKQGALGLQAGGEQDLDSYFCGVLRMMPLANIDPSLAIAFYCRSLGELGAQIPFLFILSLLQCFQPVLRRLSFCCEAKLPSAC